MVENLKKLIMSKRSDRLLFGILVVLGIVWFATPAHATPALFTNGKQLIDDALFWILILVVPTAGLLIGYQGIKKMAADGDPGSVAQANKAMKNIFIAGAIALSAAGLVKVILGYFA